MSVLRLGGWMNGWNKNGWRKAFQKPVLLVLICFSAVWLGGCSTNPVTGKSELSLVSERWEIDTGEQHYAPSRQAQGGDYVADPEVQAYVQQVGQRLAAVSDRPLPYEFHVINNGVPNAWAMPGGKIAINRGLLTELDSEAELAAVLGHEIVHAAARHGAQNMQRGLLLQTASMASVLAAGDEYAALASMGAGVGSQLVNTKYSRDAEREADTYGMRYMARAGYDPQGAVDLQQTFVDMKEGQKISWFEGLFASHPPSPERLQNNRQLAAMLNGQGDLGRERYQQKIAHLKQVQPAYEAYESAKKALVNKDENTAKAELAKAIRIEPGEGHFYALLGDIALKNRQWTAAQRHFNEAIQLNDSFFYYHLRRGQAFDQLNLNDQARADFQRSAELLPTAEAYTGLGHLAQERGDMEAAKAYYSAVVKEGVKQGQGTRNEAYHALVSIDLEDNPNQYLQLQNATDSLGRWLITVHNPTQHDVGQVQITLRSPYGNKMRIDRETLASLPAGESLRLQTNIRVQPELIEHYRSEITQARLLD